MPSCQPRRRIAASASTIPLLVLGALHASGAPGRAQEAAACPAGRIEDIVIENHSVFDLEDPARSGRFEWAYRLANALHVQTETEVIRRELVFEVGDCYDVELLRDSERLLRGFPFLANADVYGIRMPGGQVQVIVDTQDEWSTRVQPRLGSGGLRGLRIGEDNLLGTGHRIGLYYENPERGGGTVYGTDYSTPQLFGSRWNMALEAARTEPGRIYSAAFTYPFVGEQGRVAFRQSASRADRYFELLMPEAGSAELTALWLPVRRERFEVGAAVRRSGSQFRHTLFGLAVAGERIGYPGAARFADDERRDLPVPFSLQTRWRPLSSVRMVLVTGQRNVWFVRRRGVDTLNGIEDVQLGVEADASIGPTLPVLSDERDLSVGLGLFASTEPWTATIVGGQFAFQGHRSSRTIPGTLEWSDVLAELSAWAYFKPHLSSRHSLVTSVSAVGGWNGRVPFQLTLGGDTGLRGYEHHVDPGGRRIVATVEHRAYLGGPFRDLFDLGSVVFADVGKIWPGDVVFGTESPVRASIGLGLRAAFPPGSRQTLRVDVGVPVDGTAGVGDLAITVGIGQARGRQRLHRDPQLTRSARYGVQSADFVYPPN
ncbi:MAG: BamA/TamA family outer membrane protein [Gemmatimonadota bacterium]